MYKGFGLVLGLVIGALCSYLFRPATIFGVPSMAEWFDPRIMREFSGSTIIICSLVGALLGTVVGVFLDRSAPNRGEALS